jgi:hypothetical protein
VATYNRFAPILFDGFDKPQGIILSVYILIVYRKYIAVFPFFAAIELTHIANIAHFLLAPEYRNFWMNQVSRRLLFAKIVQVNIEVIALREYAFNAIFERLYPLRDGSHVEYYWYFAHGFVFEKKARNSRHGLLNNY